MRKTFFLALLLLMLEHSMSYAEVAAKPSTSPEFIKASISTTIPDSHNIRDANTRDEWSTSITIYSLIIGIYALYWLKQNA